MNMGGQMSLKDYPYKGVQGQCLFNASKIQAKVTGCEIYNLTNEDDLVKVLYNQGPVVVENNIKFWRFKNSFGAGFGEDGYFRIERGNDLCGVMDDELSSAIVA
ncbi:cysteine proteinase 2-like [Hyposmocoma kahamanoa]|uniref:cysteine proteinase 2-like n=1 Tax=Hyposmocoma kahamanoa TaxID=1477025 RepID=UPI000E6D9C03|nr:cysteine proteinase 2-like [Hyposmocoma kahamanoa]